MSPAVPAISKVVNIDSSTLRTPGPDDHVIENWVFVSHTADDEPMVRQLLEPIASSRRLVLHISNRRQSPVIAETYRREILRNLLRCDWFFAALTSRSVQSEWVKFEVDWALVNKPVRRLVIARFDDCDLRTLNKQLSKVRVLDCRALEGGNPIKRWMAMRRLLRAMPR